MEDKKDISAFRGEFYPPIPTETTMFFRTNYLYQFYRFIMLNYKIMRIVIKGHS